MPSRPHSKKNYSVALLAEGVDRNASTLAVSSTAAVSPSSRRAWIEILWSEYGGRLRPVALLAEGVDRNVDLDEGLTNSQIVALLAEGVDRNSWWEAMAPAKHTSPSSRRAWIEISKACALPT